MQKRQQPKTPARQTEHSLEEAKGLTRSGSVGAERSPGGNTARKIFGETVTSLGGLEAEIMGYVWEAGRPVHAMEVAEAALYQRRAHGDTPIVFSTVATTLRRLAEKGILRVGRKPGGEDVLSKREIRTPYYSPTVGREAMAVRIMDNVSRTLLGRSMYSLLPILADSDASAADDAAEQERLTRLRQAVADAAESEV